MKQLTITVLVDDVVQPVHQLDGVKPGDVVTLSVRTDTSLVILSGTLHTRGIGIRDGIA